MKVDVEQLNTTTSKEKDKLYVATLLIRYNNREYITILYDRRNEFLVGNNNCPTTMM